MSITKKASDSEDTTTHAPVGMKAKVQKLRDVLSHTYSPDLPINVRNALHEIAGEELEEPGSVSHGVPTSTPEQRRE